MTPRLSPPTPRPTRRHLLLAMGVVAVLLTSTSRAQGPAVRQLLPAASPGARVPAVVTSRLDTLQTRAANADIAVLADSTIDIELTSGRVVRARLDRRESHRNGAETWAGHIPGEPLSSVTLVSAGGVLQGSVRLLDAAYSIEPSPDGTLHVVRLVDTDAAGIDLDPIPDDGSTPSASADTPPTATDDGSTFDLAVFYTPAARNAAGGDAAIQTRIALGVSETNTAYSNSGVIPRLRLVGTELVNHTESTTDMGADLSAFRNASDGVMDSVHTTRNALGADLMVLIVGNSAGGACGIGYVMTSLSSGFASNAFSVTAYPCISPNYTFAHELGHNMGSAHAPEDGAGQSSLYAYSFGYKSPQNVFRTIMAYNCSAGCPRVLHFSNPNVNYSSAPTGTIAQHNNALGLNNARSTIANWRQAVGGGGNTAPTIGAIGNVAINEDAATGPLAFTVGDAQTAAGSLVVTASSSNAALVPNTSTALALGGSGANRTVTVTPAANQSGSTTVTVTVNDGALSAQTSFTLSVNGVNDAPAITRTPTSASIQAGSSAQTTVTVSDIDTAGSGLSLNTSSSNANLLPNANVAVAITSTTASTRTFQVTMTPVAGQTGAATVTLTGSDGGALASTTFALTVTAATNAPPTISAVPTQSTPANTPLAVSFTVGDPDTALGSLVVQATSSNTTLVPSSGVALSGTGASRTVTLTPAANQSGTTTITLTVSDGTTVVPSAFLVNVMAATTAPNAPTALSMTVSGATLTLRWTPAATGSPATSYTVHVGTSPGGTSLPVQSTTATSLNVNVNKTGTYYARVYAVNAGGTSGPSPEASATVTSKKPGRPRATASDRTLTVAWDPPTGGEPVIGYVLEAGSAPGLADIAAVPMGTATSVTASGVPDGTYWMRVAATTSTGATDASEDVAIVMQPSGVCVGLPLAPALNAPALASTNLALTWGAPTGATAPTSYVLYAGTAPGSSNLGAFDLGSSATSFSTSVPPGIYYLRVAGRSACGVGPLSNEVAMPVGVTIPSAPGPLSASVTGGVLSLAWSAATSGPAPTSYVVEAGSVSGATNIASVNVGSATSIAGAVPPGRYYVRIRAMVAGVVGPPSNEAVVDVS